MSVNGISGSAGTGYTPEASSKTKVDPTSTKSSEDIAVVYESSKTEDANTTYSPDLQKMNALKAELSKKKQQMQQLVESMLGKQANKKYDILDLLHGLKAGTIEVDPAISAQAAKEISEDGYWGVSQTSDRLVEMAKALSGGDPDKADTMIAAMKKGFEQATKSFGDKLPDICSQTIDAAVSKMNDWKNSFAD